VSATDDPYHFTDAEYAVILDSLATQRELLHNSGHDTPIIDSALRKFSTWADTSGCSFWVVPDRAAPQVVRQVEPIQRFPDKTR